MSGHQPKDVDLVNDFITSQAPRFHSAFTVPSDFDRSTMTWRSPESPEALVGILKETLVSCHIQRDGRYVDFIDDLTKCTWHQVHAELVKAQAKALESKAQGRNVFRRAYRFAGSASSILAPGLSAIPDELGPLHGGLAMIFSVRCRKHW